MKFSKLTAIMTAGLLAFNVCTVGALADEKVTFGEMDAESNSGTTTVTITAEKVSCEQDVCLVAAYFDETGKILSIASSVNSIESDGDTLTVSLADKSADGGELRYFLWDSIAGQIPLKNGAPASPENVEVTEADVYSATLSWDDAEDDYESIASYNIYDEGILLAEGVTSTEATVDNLFWGTNYNLEVKSVDEEGVESVYGKAAPFKTAEIMTCLSEGSKIECSPGLLFNGKMGNDYWLGTYLETSAAGLPCIANTTRVYNNTPAYLCYAFTPEMLEELSSEREFIIELTYFDDNTNYIMFDYKFIGSNGVENGTRFVGPKKTGTNTWKVARFLFKTDKGKLTASTSPNDGAYTFRLFENTVNTNGTNVMQTIDGVKMGLRVHRFSAMPKSEYNPTNAYFKAEGAAFTCNMDAVDMQMLPLEKVEDRNAVKTNQFDFTITDAAVSGAADSYVVLNYFAPEEGTTITFGDEIIETVPGKWQKVILDTSYVDAASIVSNNDIYIHSVTVVAK